MTNRARNTGPRKRWLLLPAASQLVLIYPLVVEMGKWEAARMGSGVRRHNHRRSRRNPHMAGSKMGCAPPTQTRN